MEHMKMKTKGKCAHNKRKMSRTGEWVADIHTLTDTEAIAQSQIGKASLHGVGGVDTLQGLFVENEHHVDKPPSERDLQLIYDGPIDDLLLDFTSNQGHVQPAKVITAMPKQVPWPSKSVPLPLTRTPKPVPAAPQPPPESPLTDDELNGPDIQGEPPKKRVRTRRPKEELQNIVVKYQEKLHTKICELIASQNQLELKKLKMQVKAEQHAELMSVQQQIAATLGKIYDYSIVSMLVSII